jgi:hypothetical protein
VSETLGSLLVCFTRSSSTQIRTSPRPHAQTSISIVTHSNPIQIPSQHRLQNVPAALRLCTTKRRVRVEHSSSYMLIPTQLSPMLTCVAAEGATRANTSISVLSDLNVAGSRTQQQSQRAEGLVTSRISLSGLCPKSPPPPAPTKSIDPGDKRSLASGTP